MPTARWGLSASVVDGKIYAIGGAAENWQTSSYKHVEVYDPATDTWTRKSDMPTERYGLSTCVVDGKIYAIGGNSAFTVARTANEVYDPITDTWTTKSPMQQKRWGLFVGSVGNKIYAIGGGMGEVLSTVEEYDTGLSTPPPDYNIGPVADAGLPRYAAQDPVVLDGTGSYDPDDSGILNYTWQQISGPLVEISEADTASPTISGFVQTDEIQECEFELVVSDDELTSLPDSVKVVIVPDFGENTLRLANDSFDPDKPTFVFFQGGDCIVGEPYQVAWDSDWLSVTNTIDFPKGFVPDSGSNPPTYYDYGDMIIVYLSSAAPNYKMPIQTSGISTGGQPAIDVGIRLNLTYQDARYAVNRVTFFDATGYCRDYSQSISTFLTSSVNSEQCWIDNYVGTLAGSHPWLQYPSFHPDVLNVLFDKATNSSLSWMDRHTLPAYWYVNSLVSNDMNRFNNGVVAGAYWSVFGPGKNLQLASTPGVEAYKSIWYGDASSGYMDFYDESNHPGRLPEPVTLIGPSDGDVVDANGVVLSCEVSENAIGYQLLFGSEPYRVMDYMIVSDTPAPPSEVITSFPYEQTWWTIKVYDAFGSTIYADPVCVYPEKVVAPEPGLVANWKLDETQGDIAYDSVIGAFGSVYGGAIWQPTGGHEGGALEFDGIDDFISIPRVVEAQPDSFSVFAWVKDGATGQVILSQADRSDWLGADTTDGSLMSDMTFYLKTGRPLRSHAVITDGDWHHVGLLWDGSSRILYVDDIEVASDTYVTGFLYGYLQIGAGNKLEADSFWSGLIDDVRIYNRAVKP
jgi:hypothetical protein